MKFYEITNRAENNFSCIYCWENLVNGKRYIGQTVRFYDRMLRYRNGHFNPHMKAAIDKYGIENFDITIVEKDVPTESLNEREQYWIDYYECCNPDKGYNICPIAGSTRGCVPWNKGLEPTQEHKENIAAGLRRYYQENDVWNKGIPQTEEAKQKNRLANLGENNGMYGKHHSEETKKKIRNAVSGRKHPRSERAKMTKRSVRCVETGVEYLNAQDAADDVGCSYTAIWLVLNGKNRVAKGLHWEYIS